MNTTGNTTRWKAVSFVLLICCIALAAAVICKSGNSDAAPTAGKETKTAQEQKEISATGNDDPLAKAREAMMQGIEERKKHPEKYKINVSDKSLIEALSERYESPDKK